MKYLSLSVAAAALAAASAFAFAAPVADEAANLEFHNEHVAVAISRQERGAIVSLKDAAGEEFVAAQKSPNLFSLTLSRKAASPTEQFTLTAHDAKNFQASLRREGKVQIATLEYDGLKTWPLRVVCTARLTDGERLVRWRITVQTGDDLVLESIRFPQIVLQVRQGETADSEAALVGSTKGGLIRQPGAMKVGTGISAEQPGTMAAQFGCYYDSRAGFYTASLDAAGYPKKLILTRAKEGIEVSWHRAMFASGSISQEYDAVMATFSASASPADWRHAADLYKEWAVGQPWCATLYANRRDVPAWMKAGPAMVRFNRAWLAEPDRIDRWLAECWQKEFPAAPLIVAYWGWEKNGSWIAPDYFPVFPSDKQFTAMVQKWRKLDAHAFCWPSGYHWTVTYRKRPDGSFERDDRKRFDELALGHAVKVRDGSVYIRTPSWLAGGDTSCLCGGDEWTHRWWNDEVCVPLARRGCEIVQVDQVLGGRFPACYSSAHGHPLGAGVWQTESFTKQLTSMLATMRKVQADSVVCYEEPNELFNHLVGIQDYRDCESPYEWASVFNYLYHEYLPTFQSNPREGDLVRDAHCLADGQIPHIFPSQRDLGGPVLINGGFDGLLADANVLVGWDHIRSSQGQDWPGKAAVDESEKHSGRASLHLDNERQTDTVRVLQNVKVGENALAVGKKYRLSAFLKTEKMAQPNAVSVAFPGKGDLAGNDMRLKFPSAGDGWTKASVDFTVPQGAGTLQIVIHLVGQASAWVDDVTLEEVLADGSIKAAEFSGVTTERRLMRRWVELYHGEGRPWLQFGKMLHPPKLTCQTISYSTQDRQNGVMVTTKRTMPAVFHNAFRAPDGSEAVVLANATAVAQQVTLEWKGKPIKLEVPPAGALLVK